MNFIDSINEGVLFNSQLKNTLNELKSKFFDETIKNKIKFEINQNWAEFQYIYSPTYLSIIEKSISDGYKESISIEFDNRSENYGEYYENKIFINISKIASEQGLFKFLKKMGKIAFIDDFLSATINVISHELTHYSQEKTRNIEILGRIQKKLVAKNYRYFDDKDEMMSFAIGIAQNLKYQGYEQKEALEIISTGIDSEGLVPDRDLKRYYLINKFQSLENWKKFLKYLYSYINNHWSEL